MNRQTLADVLQSTNQTGSYTLATVLEGAEAGSQLLLRDGDALWQTQSAELLQRQLAVLQACTATGFLILEGQRVFAERFGAVPQLVVCGGGHVAAALVKQAKLLGMPVLAIDDREEFAQQLRAAGADTVLCAPFAQALQDVPGGAETYFAVLTRSHAFDLDCLTRILQKPAAYVGMMGSRGRAALVRRQLLENGLDSQRIDALCAPIGLAIGAQTAAEIALSILAQIVQVKNARPQTEGYPVALLDAMVQAEKARTPAVLATIVARHGSTPRDVGAKMLILPDGSTVGSVGGGIMEYRTRQAAAEMLAGHTAAVLPIRMCPARRPHFGLTSHVGRWMYFAGSGPLLSTRHQRRVFAPSSQKTAQNSVIRFVQAAKIAAGREKFLAFYRAGCILKPYRVCTTSRGFIPASQAVPHRFMF